MKNTVLISITVSDEEIYRSRIQALSCMGGEIRRPTRLSSVFRKWRGLKASYHLEVLSESTLDRQRQNQIEQLKKGCILERMADAYDRPLSPLSPHLFVSNADAAIDFYQRAFGADLLTRHPAPDGKRLMHAALLINGSVLMLCDDFPEYRGGKGSTPEALGGSPVVLHLQVKEADSVFNKAVAAGATVAMPLSDQFWGDRYGQITDPFGHTWSIGSPVKKMTDEEVAEAAKQHF